MPFADPAKNREASRESMARKTARDLRVPKRLNLVPTQTSLRSLGDVLCLLEESVDMVRNDECIDAATVSRHMIQAAKAAHEALRDHGLASDIADLQAAIAALRENSGILVLNPPAEALALGNANAEAHAEPSTGR